MKNARKNKDVTNISRIELKRYNTVIGKHSDWLFMIALDILMILKKLDVMVV